MELGHSKMTWRFALTACLSYGIFSFNELNRGQNEGIEEFIHNHGLNMAGLASHHWTEDEIKHLLSNTLNQDLRLEILSRWCTQALFFSSFIFFLELVFSSFLHFLDPLRLIPFHIRNVYIFIYRKHVCCCRSRCSGFCHCWWCLGEISSGCRRRCCQAQGGFPQGSKTKVGKEAPPDGRNGIYQVGQSVSREWRRILGFVSPVSALDIFFSILFLISHFLISCLHLFLFLLSLVMKNKRVT